MNSLAVRLFFSATVWIILTLVSAGLLLSDLNQNSNADQSSSLNIEIVENRFGKCNFGECKFE